MEYSGDFRTAIRGPVLTIQRLPGLPKKWFASLPKEQQTPRAKRERNVLIDGMKVAADIRRRWWGTAKTSWWDITTIPLVYLDYLEYMAKAFPKLEIAVVVSVKDRSTGQTHERSYYSRPGETTLHPDRLEEIPPINKVPGHPFWDFPPEAMEWIRFR